MHIWIFLVVLLATLIDAEQFESRINRLGSMIEELKKDFKGVKREDVRELPSMGHSPGRKNGPKLIRRLKICPHSRQGLAPCMIVSISILDNDKIQYHNIRRLQGGHYPQRGRPLRAPMGRGRFQNLPLGRNRNLGPNSQRRGLRPRAPLTFSGNQSAPRRPGQASTSKFDPFPNFLRGNQNGIRNSNAHQPPKRPGGISSLILSPRKRITSKPQVLNEKPAHVRPVTTNTLSISSPKSVTTTTAAPTTTVKDSGPKDISFSSHTSEEEHLNNDSGDSKKHDQIMKKMAELLTV